ncbi:MAG: peptidase [Acidobacteria bacterium]|nr:MAG: peptidase [Acidobacteriota bacterium]
MAEIAPQEIVEASIAAHQSDGAIAFAHSSASRNARFASNRLTTSGESRRVSLTAVAIRDGAVGSLRSDVSTAADAAELMRGAEKVASRSQPAADAFSLYQGSRTNRVELEAGLPEPDAFFEFAAAHLNEVFEGARASALETFGYLEEESDAVYLATSTGCRDAWFEDRSHFGITVKTEGWNNSVWSGQTGQRVADLNPPSAFDHCLELLSLASSRASVDAGRYDVVLSSSCVADMLIWMYWLMALRDADEGKSVFSNRQAGGNRIGESMYPAMIHLRSDPAARAMECLPFVVTSASHSLESVFDNGMPLAAVDWIDSGRQVNLVSTRSYASKSGLDPAPYVGNLILDGNEGSSLDLVGEVERGLYVNCLWYIRMVDPQSALLTGLTRDGVYLIEDGKIVGETNNFRFNMSPVDMLSGAAALGDSVIATPREFDDVGIGVKAPPMIVKGWNMSTVSDAL